MEQNFKRVSGLPNRVVYSGFDKAASTKVGAMRDLKKRGGPTSNTYIYRTQTKQKYKMMREGSKAMDLLNSGSRIRQ